MSIGVGDILRVAAIAAFTDSNVAQMIFNAVITGSGGPFDEDDIVADALAWINSCVSYLTTSTTDTLDGSEIIVYIYDAIDDDWDEVGSTAWGWNPSSALDALPRAVALLINCKTSDPDVNGKKYFPGLTEAANDDGSWSSGILTTATGFADDWTDPFVGGTSGADWTPGVWSPTNTNFYYMSGAYIIPAEPAYQRRRKRGVGA